MSSTAQPRCRGRRRERDDRQALGRCGRAAGAQNCRRPSEDPAQRRASSRPRGELPASGPESAEFRCLSRGIEYRETDAAPFDALRAGDIGRTRSVVRGAFAAGIAIEELGDAVITPAISRLGSEWEHGRIDVMHEHRGTLICTSALDELKPALEATAEIDRPIAAGGSRGRP